MIFPNLEPGHIHVLTLADKDRYPTVQRSYPSTHPRAGIAAEEMVAVLDAHPGGRAFIVFPNLEPGRVHVLTLADTNRYPNVQISYRLSDPRAFADAEAMVEAMDAHRGGRAFAVTCTDAAWRPAPVAGPQSG